MRSLLVLSLSLCCCCGYGMNGKFKAMLEPIAEEDASGKEAVSEHKVAVDLKEPLSSKRLYAPLIINEPVHVRSRVVVERFDIEITSGGCVIIEKGAALVVRNATVTGVSRETLLFVDKTSLLSLDGAKLVFDGDYVFKEGIINIKGPCFFEGVSVRKSVHTDEDFVWSMEWDSLNAIFTRKDYATLFLKNFVIHKTGPSKARDINYFLCEYDFPSD